MRPLCARQVAIAAALAAAICDHHGARKALAALAALPVPLGQAPAAPRRPPVVRYPVVAGPSRTPVTCHPDVPAARPAPIATKPDVARRRGNADHFFLR